MPQQMQSMCCVLRMLVVPDTFCSLGRLQTRVLCFFLVAPHITYANSYTHNHKQKKGIKHEQNVKRCGRIVSMITLDYKNFEASFQVLINFSVFSTVYDIAHIFFYQGKRP